MELISSTGFDPGSVREQIGSALLAAQWEGRELRELSFDAHYTYIRSLITATALPALSALPNSELTETDIQARKKEKTEGQVGRLVTGVIVGVTAREIYRVLDRNSQQWAARAERNLLIFSAIYYIGAERFSRLPRVKILKRDNWIMRGKDLPLNQHFLIRYLPPDAETTKQGKVVEWKFQFVIRVIDKKEKEQVLLFYPDPDKSVWLGKAAGGSTVVNLPPIDQMSIAGTLKSYQQMILLFQQAANRQLGTS